MFEIVFSCFFVDVLDVFVIMVEVVIRGGQEVKVWFFWLQIFDIMQKVVCDYQIEVDIEVERIIVSYLVVNFFDIDIYGEEGVVDCEIVGVKVWFLIDFIDGIINYVWGILYFGNVVIFVDKGEIMVGVVYDVMQDELFFVEKGKGVFFNGWCLDMCDGDDVVNFVFGVSFLIFGQVKFVFEDVYYVVLC